MNSVICFLQATEKLVQEDGCSDEALEALVADLSTKVSTISSDAAELLLALVLFAAPYCYSLL